MDATRIIVGISILAVLLAPSAAYAGNADVTSYTSASADTGGNSVGSGGSEYAGSASASVHSTTIVNDDGGSVDVHVEISRDGATSSQSYHADAAPGQAVRIDVATSSGKGSVGAHVEAHGAAPTSSPVAHAPEARSRPHWIFSRIFSWLGW